MLFTTLTAYGQGRECVEPLCNQLSVEVVRHENVTPGCAGDSVLCSDQFRQIRYTVYLRRSKTVSASDPLLDYDLEYDMLDVSVSLLPLNPGPQFSHIDANATQTCFENGVGMKWDYPNGGGNEVIFSATPDRVSISFANFNSGYDCGTEDPPGKGNVITFTYTTPPLVAACGSGGPNNPPIIRCAYAELFTVVVNAYAGENNALQFDNPTYVLDVSPGHLACEIEEVTTGANNGLNNNFVVTNPTHYTSTPNERIIAEFLPGISGNGDEKIFAIQLRNTGPETTVNYLEFMVKAMTVNMDQTFDYTGAHPREALGASGAGPAIKYLHYLIPIAAPGITLGVGGTHLVGTIIVKPLLPVNQNWSVDFSFQDSGPHPSKSRIQSSLNGNPYCTSLNASFGHSSFSNPGDAPCSDPSVLFNVEGEGLTCWTSKVKVGLSSTNAPPDVRRLSKVEFELDFSWTAPGIMITGVNFPNWPASNLDCEVFGCIDPPFPAPNSCWEVSPNGKTFKYCYETDDTNAPIFHLDEFPYMEILFNTPGNTCIENVAIRTLRITYVGTTVPCIPVIDPIDGFALCGSTASMLSGTIATETLGGIEEVTVTLSGADADPNAGSPSGMIACPDVSCSPDPCAPAFDLSDDAGMYLFSCTACPSCNLVKVIPERDDNPLNGVTTYDLVLISKHILGTEPLNSPYKMIAADANKSGSITTFDIVEIRKLILGIYTDLPNNKSWRFVDKAFVFPNLNNPFQTAFPEGINCIGFPTTGNDFTGLKVGDVNNTAVGNRPVERPTVGLSWPNLRSAPGGTITVPVSYSGTELMEAIQLGIRFDPGKLQLIGPSIGDIESYLPGNFNLLKAGNGEIRTLWLPMTDGFERVQPGSVLFYLTFKVLEELPGDGLPLWLDSQLLDCAAWKSDGGEFAVQHAPALTKRDEPVAPAADLMASIHPNPTKGDATLVVQALKAEKGRIALFDAFGRRLFVRDVLFQEGKQDIPLPEVAPLPTGVYVWKVYTPSFKTQGHLVKQ
ncbi:MAG: T9SS type A sorting domain-containing protein [Saprospiraceae bacterium]|nr:T9SS type A sorting domain-containing protein [Saprospiraceae bacterium]